MNKGSYWDQKEPRPAEESVTIRFHRKRDGLTLRGARVAQARKVLTVDRRWTDDFALKLTFRGAHVAENVIKVDKWDPPPEREISRDC